MKTAKVNAIIINFYKKETEDPFVKKKVTSVKKNLIWLKDWMF